MKKPAERLRPFNPLAGVFEFDRGFHEGRAAEAVIGHLADKEGWRVKSWEPRPTSEANPDFVVVLEDGRRVGIEVTELIDCKYAEQMRVAKNRGGPIPPPREWDAAGLEKKDRSDLVKKDQKRPTWGGRLDEYLVGRAYRRDLNQEPTAYSRRCVDTDGCGGVLPRHESFLRPSVRAQVSRCPTADLRNSCAAATQLGGRSALSRQSSNKGTAMPSPWLLIVWIPLLAGINWLLALIPLWGWLFIIVPIIGLIYLPYYYLRRLKTHLAWRRREQAIQRAIAAMSPDERDMWFNREGPYQDVRCIPRNTTYEFMTEKERSRYNKTVGEFSEREYEPASSLFYD